jgi:hypothetical protein
MIDDPHVRRGLVDLAEGIAGRRGRKPRKHAPAIAYSELKEPALPSRGRN